MTCGQSDVRSETLLLECREVVWKIGQSKEFDLYLKPKDSYNGMGCEMYERKDFKILYSIVIVMCRHFTTRRIYDMEALYRRSKISVGLYLMISYITNVYQWDQSS